jgi:putative phage-type endonuclease
MKDIVDHYFKSNELQIDRSIYEIIESDYECDKETSDSIERLIDTSIQDIKELLCKNTLDVHYYLKNVCRDIVYEKYELLKDLESKREHILEKMDELKALELPEQRSKEWYEIREGLLTASSLADALGKGHFTTRDQLLINKTTDKKPEFEINPIMQWGVKYEPVATVFYEQMFGVDIVEFGLIPHPELSVFGASPDGICDTTSSKEYIGRMLEIKCPPKRQFTNEVPLHYWMQMQGQLEVCDLEECDFLQVKIEEYNSFREYVEDTPDSNFLGQTKEGLPKGLVLTFKIQEIGKTEYSLHYEYSPWSIDNETLRLWKENTIKETLEKYLCDIDIHCSLLEEKYWSIKRYECTLVRRDKKWWFSVVPEIIKFWDDVTYYRRVGNEEVQKKIDSRKRKKKPEKDPKVFVMPKLAEGCHILSSSDEEDNNEEK